jgi:hypothetical protein
VIEPQEFEFYANLKLKKYKSPFALFYWEFEERNRNKKRVFTVQGEQSNHIKYISVENSPKVYKETKLNEKELKLGYDCIEEHISTKNSNKLDSLVVAFKDANGKYSIKERFDFYVNPLLKIKMSNVSKIVLTERFNSETKASETYIYEYKSNPQRASFYHKIIFDFDNENSCYQYTISTYFSETFRGETLDEKIVKINSGVNYGKIRTVDVKSNKLNHVYNYKDGTTIRIVNKSDTLIVITDKHGQFLEASTKDGSDFNIPILEENTTNRNDTLYRYNKNIKNHDVLIFNTNAESISYKYVKAFNEKVTETSRKFNPQTGRLWEKISQRETMQNEYDKLQNISDSLIFDDIHLQIKRDKNAVIEYYYEKQKKVKFPGEDFSSRTFEYKYDNSEGGYMVYESFSHDNEAVKGSSCNCHMIGSKYNNLNQLVEKTFLISKEKIDTTIKNMPIKFNYYYDRDGKLTHTESYNFSIMDKIKKNSPIYKKNKLVWKERKTVYDKNYKEISLSSKSLDDNSDTIRVNENGIHRTVSRIEIPSVKTLIEFYRDAQGNGVKAGVYNQCAYQYEFIGDTIEVVRFYDIHSKEADEKCLKQIDDSSRVAQLWKVYDKKKRLIKEYRVSGDTTKLIAKDWNGEFSFMCKKIEYAADSGNLANYVKKISFWKDIKCTIKDEYEGFHSKEQSWEWQFSQEIAVETKLKYEKANGNVFIPEDTACNCYKETSYSGPKTTIEFKDRQDKPTNSKTWGASELEFDYNEENNLVRFTKSTTEIVKSKIYSFEYKENNILSQIDLEYKDGKYHVAILFDVDNVTPIGYKYTKSRNENGKLFQPSDRQFMCCINGIYYDKDMQNVTKEIKDKRDTDLEFILRDLGVIN